MTLLCWAVTFFYFFLDGSYFLSYSVSTAMLQFFLEIPMAAGDKMEFSALERQWICQSLITQRNVLIRSRNKEMAGSEIWVLRGREIDVVSNLISRMS